MSRLLVLALVACHAATPRPPDRDAVVIVSANAEWRALEQIVHPTARGTTPWGETLEDNGVLYIHGGWGKVAAAASAQYAIDRWHPRVLVNLGTAGALRDEAAQGTGLHEVGEVLNHEISADAIRALGFDPHERLRVGDAETVLASGDVFVTDPAVRARLAREAHLVDMEGYAYAWVAREFGLPIRMVKHVSDGADEGAMAWVDLVDRSARILGEWAAARLG